MEPLLFRAPGRALSWAALAQRLIDSGVVDAPPTRVGRLQVDGQSWRGRDEPIPAGALVRVEADALRPLAVADEGDAFDVLVPAPPWRAGRLRLAEGDWLEYRVTEVRGALAALRIGGCSATPAEVLDALAAAGMPALGDARRGGILVSGGTRIGPARGEASPHEAIFGGSEWPSEPVVAPGGSEEGAAPQRSGRRPGKGPGDGGALPLWRVSRATARVVGAGHPWLLPDDETEPVDRWRPGSLVEAVAPGGAPVAVVRVEGPGPIAARVWSRPAAGNERLAASIAGRVRDALARRAKGIERGSARTERDGRPFTDALRLIHGEADGLPGIAVDRLGPVLRLLVTSHAAALAMVDPIAEALCAANEKIVGPAEGVVVVLHLGRDTRARHICVSWWRAPEASEGGSILDDRGRLVVHERGLRFRVDPGLSDPENPRPGVGLFIDQRENRQRLARVARRGGRWLNLFAHTGAFSVALLAAGAEEVVSVDLSKPYLDWLDENLALNEGLGVDAARHRSVRRDGRRHLEELPASERFAGIVLDPPTAASAGRRFWSARRDLQPLVGAALTRLAPGGVLLVSLNQRRARGDLADWVRAAAGDRGVRLERVEATGPGPDLPRLRGFPEGDAFRGAIATRR